MQRPSILNCLTHKKCMFVWREVKMCFDVQLICSQSEVNADAPKHINKQERDYRSPCEGGQFWP